VNAATLQAANIYGAALLQGFALVSFPASASVLMSMHGIDDARYGAIFLPQVACAVVGATLGAQLSEHLRLPRLLALALLANCCSQLALASSQWLPQAWVYPIILCGTAMLGLGFGLTGAPLNGIPPQLFPRQANSALVVAHTMIGAGLMLGPLLLAALRDRLAWAAFPLLLAASLALFAAASAALARHAPQPRAVSATRAGAAPGSSPVFWTFAAIAVLYAFAEGTFSNWTVVYLTQAKMLPEATAASALAAFWGALVGGRLLVSILVLRVPARTIWLALPGLMIAAFLALPFAHTGMLAVAIFALAGLACSAFFPLSIALASERHPDHAAWVASMLIAALMLGVGLGSFTIGALRELVSFEDLYRGSAAYPALALVLALLLPRAEKFFTRSAAA
jgi:predicted MFS family arabinose efflux permease